MTYLTRDANGSAFRVLGKSYSTVDVGVTLEDSNSLYGYFAFVCMKHCSATNEHVDV